MGCLSRERFEAGSAKASWLLDTSAFANCGYRIKLRVDVFGTVFITMLNLPRPLRKKNYAGGEPSVFCRLECRRLGWSRVPTVLLINWTDKRKIVYSESFIQRTEAAI